MKMGHSMSTISNILANPIKTIFLLSLATTNGFGIIHTPISHEEISKVISTGISCHVKYFSFQAIAADDEIAGAEKTQETMDKRNRYIFDDLKCFIFY